VTGLFSSCLGFSSDGLEFPKREEVLFPLALLLLLLLLLPNPPNGLGSDGVELFPKSEPEPPALAFLFWPKSPPEGDLLVLFWGNDY